MATTTLAELEAQLNQLILAGRNEEAIVRFYADDAQLQENDEPAIVGKPAILAREASFAANVDQERSQPTVLHAGATGEGVTFSEWTYDMTFKDGTHFVLHEIARRVWREGRVTHEQFFYSKG